MILRRAMAAMAVCVAATLAIPAVPASSQVVGGPEPGMHASEAELNLVFVVDGLRPDSITAAETPNLFRLREQGVNFPNSHAVVPTVTRVNSAVLGTGHQPGTNGIVGNEIYVPSVDPAKPISTASASQLLKLREAEGRIALTETLGERLQAQGKRLVAIGSGTSGATLLLNPTAPDGTGVMINAGSSDGPRAFPAEVGQEMERRFGPPPTDPGTSKVDYLIRALNEYVLTDLDPDVVLTWMTEPDGSQHEHGVGSPEAMAAIRNDDRNIGLVMDQLERLEIADKTNIMIVSDHGFSATDYAVNISQELVKAGLKESAASTDVVVANTGSVALHVKGRDPARIEAISRFLLRRSDVDTVFTAAREPRDGRYIPVEGDSDSVHRMARGWVDGTFSLELIQHANTKRGADIVVTFPWSGKPNAYGVPGTATTSAGGTSPTGPRTGNGSTHGSFSPYDVRNTFLGWGVDFKDGVESLVPAGNIDVAPTLLALEGLSTRGTEGRVLREALNGGPAPSSVRSETRSVTVSSEADSYRGEVRVSEVRGLRYIAFSRRLPADRGTRNRSR